MSATPTYRLHVQEALAGARKASGARYRRRSGLSEERDRANQRCERISEGNQDGEEKDAQICVRVFKLLINLPCFNSTSFRLDDDIFQTPVPLDENHPDFQDRGLYLIGDNNVLVEHMPQTQVLLNTLVIEGLPERVSKAFEKTKLPADLERSMQQSVLVSHLLDAEQQKLAPIKDPLKPMRGLPRPYGITDARKKY